MDTPVLTKKQQRYSLSGRKAGATKGLRNILAQPNETYWPVVKEDSAKKLGAHIKQVLCTMKRPSVKIPWSRLRHMKKDERNEVKRQAIKNCQSQFDENSSKHIILGINAVTRSLEKNNICCVLLDATVEPMLLIKHIILMAQNKMIPLLILPSLKKLSYESLGFSCCALALKNLLVDSTEDEFHKLYENVCILSEDYPAPKQPLSLSFNSEETVNSDILEDKQKEGEDSTKKDEKKHHSTVSQAVEPMTVADVYLYRTSNKERVFVPKSSKRDLKAIHDDETDFISFNTISTKESMKDNKTNERYFKVHKEKVEHSPERNDAKKYMKSNKNQSNEDVIYLPLKVKRMQGNVKRLKATKLPKKKR